MRGMDNALLVFNFQVVFVAPGGAHLAAERVGAERRQKSEAQPNGEGVAAGGATVI